MCLVHDMLHFIYTSNYLVNKCPHFINKKMEAQRGKMTLSKVTELFSIEASGLILDP